MPSFTFERLQGESPDVVGYLIQRDAAAWVKEIGTEIDSAQRDAGRPRIRKKDYKQAIAYGAQMCAVRDRIMDVVEKGTF